MSIGSLGITNRTNSAFTEVWFLRYANPVSNNYRLFRNGNQITSKCAGASRHAPPSHTFVSVTLFFLLDTHNTLPGTRPTHQGTSDIIFVHFKTHISMIFLQQFYYYKPTYLSLKRFPMYERNRTNRTAMRTEPREPRTA